MLKKVKLEFCDYCNSEDLNKVTQSKCRICEKFYCRECSYNAGSSYGMYGNSLVPYCKHCKKILFKEYQKFPRLTDYKLSGSSDEISVSSFMRHYTDMFVELGKNLAVDIFVEKAKSIVEGKQKEIDLKAKEQELIEKFNEEMRLLKNNRN